MVQVVVGLFSSGLAGALIALGVARVSVPTALCGAAILFCLGRYGGFQ